jgi:rSAM/selenodomain-associated transferase 1
LHPALIIFIKNPEKGKVMPRLAEDVGDDAALTVYNQLLHHTRVVTQFFSGDKYLFYSDYPNWNDAWDIATYRKRIQQGDDLSQRIQAAVNSVLEEGHDRAIIIGSNCYDLSLQVLNAAVAALDTHEVVIGPAHNGGYYLLGVRTKQPTLLSKVEWNTRVALDTVVNALHNAHLTYQLLPVLHDLDNAEDLAHSGLLYQ